MQAMYDRATELGARFEYTDLTHLGRDGDTNIHTRVIRLQEGLLYRLHRSVGWHELGHIVNEDEKNMFGYMDDRQERRADEYAALNLINLDEYRLAEERFGTNIEFIAQELCVMDWVVEAFERMLTRIGDTVYLNARLGHGNWAAKFEVA